VLNKNVATVFTISLLLSITTLLIERILGINWDFHPDSVTYATESSNIFKIILEGETFDLVNNFYYVVVHFFGESIVAVIILNIILYSITNAKMYVILKDNYKNENFIYIYILIFVNPYRLHLSTTMLKDTLIIFLLLCIYVNKNKLLIFVIMILTRLASIIYILPMLSKKMLSILVIIFIGLFITDFTPLIDFLIKSSENEMTFREFDKMPTFKELGLIGSIIRSVTWMLLSFSGLFIFVSPSIMFLPITIGIFATVYSQYKLSGNLGINLEIAISLLTFGILVTGFTSYIRYIYPILCMAPIIFLNDKLIKKYENNKSKN
jgi:hypothetical protein